MWRAFLADGRVIDHDGDNSPQLFLDLIVRFQVFAPNGAMLADLEPAVNERVIWRFVRENTGAVRRTVGCKVGVVDRATGEVRVQELDGTTGRWAPTDDVVLDAVELA